LLKPGGVLLALKGSAADEELQAARDVLPRLGGVGAEVVTVGGGVVDPATTVVRIYRSPSPAEQRAQTKDRRSRP
jgi:16S rRNA (guanine527-N7)-methyltransferase